ncbi:TerB family tellurite resistance protein [Undibacterium sp.]|uniref:tellurite resistance TerB family protein n=1 Tax=Undibacterium sp. TaxID=1914977 RepID=UPI0025FF85BA|nr:TerB family tellurite resistance protein [Undibacterium sp.]
MRSYPQNSKLAMARILGLAMLADGGLDQSEIEVVADSRLLARIDMTEAEFDTVLHHLCEDMLQSMRGYDYGKIELDRLVIDRLLTEVSHPSLQRVLLNVMLAVVDADGKLSEGEAVLLTQALEKWQCNLVDLRYTEAYRAAPEHIRTRTRAKSSRRARRPALPAMSLSLSLDSARDSNVGSGRAA